MHNGGLRITGEIFFADKFVGGMPRGVPLRPIRDWYAPRGRAHHPAREEHHRYEDIESLSFNRFLL